MKVRLKAFDPTKVNRLLDRILHHLPDRKMNDQGILMSRARPNQSLKLTEVAVDDFAARQYAENDIISRYIRAMNYMELAARCRSLAPVR